MNRLDFLKTCVVLGAYIGISEEAIALAAAGQRRLLPAEPNEFLYGISAFGEDSPEHGWIAVSRGPMAIMGFGLPRAAPFYWSARPSSEILFTDDLTMKVNHGAAYFAFTSGRIVFVSDSEMFETWKTRR